MTNSHRMRQWFPALLACTLASALVAAAEPQPATPASAAQPEQKAKTLDTILVTGTHIRGADKETEHPLLRIKREDLLRTGLADVGQIVQSLVVDNGQALGRKINNNALDDRGEERVNLRSLGENRTLVLVNGQRWAPDVDGAVDLSAIPLALVDRIEVLKDGASAIYGSDAIGGVVNIITRKQFDGAQLGLYAGGNAHGDGASRNADFSFGREGERWQASFGFEYGKDDPILASARAISAVPAPGLPLGATGSSVSSYGVFTVPGMGRLVLIPGRTGRSVDDFRDFDPATDTNFNFQPYNYLQTPQERRAVFGQARWEINESVALNIDALYNRRDSAQRLAPPTVSFSSTQFTGEQGFDVSPDNLYNPFGVPVTTVKTRFVEAGPRQFAQQVDTTRLHLGLDGFFSWAGVGWDWGVDALRTRSSQDEHTGPYADNERLAFAVGPSFRDSSGTPRCGTPGQVIAGCVPIDLFSGPGRLTPDMLAYVDVDLDNRKTVQSDVLSAHISGKPFQMPAGAVGFAAGVVRRIERGSDITDPLLASGRANGTGVTNEPTSGGYSVNEAYLEFSVPLLADKPLARKLELDAATRYSRYSQFGGTDNSSLGLRWQPMVALLLRANLAQGFRAPSIFEAFGGSQHTNFGNIIDPCVATDANQPPAHCAAQGVPADVQQPLEVDSTIGSNPALQPEHSRSLNLGLVYSPAWLQGLDASLDWYRFKIRDAIAPGDVQRALDECYTHGDAVACSYIARNPDGTLKHVLAINENVPGGLQTEGLDFSLHWKRTTRLGDFDLRWENAYVTYWGEIGKPKFGTILADGSSALGNVTGTNLSPYGAIWRWRSVASLAWQRKAWGGSITARYFSAITEDCSYVAFIADRVGDPSLLHLCSDPNHVFVDGETGPVNRLGAVTYIDLEGHWDTPWKARLGIGMRNAFDRQPPQAWSYNGANSFLPEYDIPGRFWYASYRQSF